MKKIARKYYERNGGVKGGDHDTSLGVLVPIQSLIQPDIDEDEEEYKQQLHHLHTTNGQKMLQQNIENILVVYPI